VNAINGYTGEVDLSVTGLPTDVSAQFSPPSVTGPATSTLTLITSTNTPLGDYLLTVSGTSSSTTHTSTVTLTISAGPVVIPDWWKQQYFNCTGCPQADAEADPDGDGWNNLAEFLAGTDPTNSASAFRITDITLQDGDILVVWQGGGGTTNVVQAASDPCGNYTDISSNIVLFGCGDVNTNFLDVGAATNDSRCYRTRLVP
jgi:hypothetical protein